MFGRGSSWTSAAYFSQRFLRVVGQLRRHRDLDGHQQVAVTTLLGRAPAPHPQRAPRRRAGRDLERHRAVEGRHPDRGSQRGLGVRHRNGQREVVALAGEQLVLADVHGHVQVAGRATAGSGQALARDPDLGAVLDAGRHPDVDRAGLGRDAAAAAVGARLVDQLAGALAVAARLAEAERALVVADETRARTGRAGPRRGAGLGAVAATGAAGSRTRQLQRQRLAAHRLVEAQRHLGVGVLPAGRAGARGPAAGYRRRRRTGCRTCRRIHHRPRRCRRRPGRTGR